MAPQTGKTVRIPPQLTECLAVAFLKGAVDLALDITLGHVLALVVELLAATQTQQQLYAAVGIKVEFQRNQRITTVAKFAVKKVDLLAVQQQTTPTVGIAIPECCRDSSLSKSP